MALSFAFDPSKGETPQTIAQRRQMSNLIAAQMLGRAPKNVGEGLNAIGQALIARSMMGDADAAQKAGEASLPDFLKSQITGQPATSPIAAPSAATTPPMGNVTIPPPAAPTVGKIYSNDEPSPLDPPSGADRNALIQTVLGEAGNQGSVGMNAVASVIRNRAINGGFGGDTPTGVVTAPNQFEPWNTAGGRSRMAAAAADPAQRAAADRAIALAYGEGGTAPTDPTNGALNFFSPKAQAALGRPVPSWAQGPGQDIGDHRFFGGQPQQPYQVAGPAVAAPQVQQGVSPDGGVLANNSPSPLDNEQYPAGPVGSPTAGDGESLASTANAAVATPQANAQPAQGVPPTTQIAPSAPQPQNRFLFKNASDEDLQKALLNPFTPTNIRAALTQEATLRANAAQKAADPLHQMQLQDARNKLTPIGQPYKDADGNLVQKDALGKVTVLSPADKTPNSVGEYGFYAKQETDAGRVPLPYGQWDVARRRSGATNVNTGTIPKGYEQITDPVTGAISMRAIPGGPADTSKHDQVKADAQDTSSNVIISAAKLAQNALASSGLPASGTVSTALSPIGETNAAELRRQIDVLKANASIETLNQMRQQSKTGGALGSVTEGEERLLAAKSGALDPKAPPEKLKAAISDYEHTLLQVVHGKEAGDKIYEAAHPASPAPSDGAIAVNPKTGVRLIRQNGKWVPFT